MAADETSGDSGQSGSLNCLPAEPIVEALEEPVVLDYVDAIDPAVVCPNLAMDLPPSLTPSVQVIRPSVGAGQWPAQKLPMIMFSPGAGQQHDLYLSLFEPLASIGFVSVLVETSRNQDSQNLTPASRASALACALRWIATQWEDRERLSCDLVLAGHSRGGGAAYLVGGNIDGIPWGDINPEGVDYNLRAVVSIAAAANADIIFPGEPVPFLGLMGATDEDPSGQEILQYDRIILDELAAADPNDLPPKYLLVPYDVPHNAWGGGVEILGALPITLPDSEYQAKAEAIWLAHAPLFLEWTVWGQNSALARGRLEGTDVPAALDQPGWWSYLEPAYTELGSSPVMPRAFTVDTRDAGGVRIKVDDFEDGVAFSDMGFNGITQVGVPAELVPGNDWMGQSGHRSNALLVEWGSDPQAPGARGGDLEWTIEDDTSGAEFVSLRIAQLPRGSFGTPVMGGLPCELSEPSAMEPELPDMTDAVTIEVTVVDGDSTATQTLNPAIQQEARRVVQNAGGGALNKCVVVNFLQTLRLPLSDFVGVEPSDLQSLVLTFEEQDEVSAVLIDTIEFTGG